jgi:cell fate regulator YaaT (PSP1 superfamily)
LDHPDQTPDGTPEDTTSGGAPSHDGAPAPAGQEQASAPAPGTIPPAPAQQAEPAAPGQEPDADAARGSGPGGLAQGGTTVAGVRLHGQVRVTQVNVRGLDLDLGQQVIVESDRGAEIGEVVQPSTQVRASCGLSCMARVARLASTEDLRAHEESRSNEEAAYAWCRDRIRERNMPMRLVRVERSMESRRLVFQFTAEGRVDFRDLVRDLAQRFRTRIEMRQIGVRDEAAVGGGYGPCGRALCCSTFLRGFAPVSIKMAKSQKLSLNPSKLSGMCGRLKCCLRYEYEFPAGAAAVAPEDEALPPVPGEGSDGAEPPPA